jgi:hypothetical protein
VTKADGTYALQLEEGVEWVIKFYFVPRDGLSFTTNGVSADSAVTPTSSQQTRNGEFVVVT